MGTLAVRHASDAAGDEEAVGVGEGPGEEEDLAGGGAGFGGGFDGGDGLEVVAADAGDAVVGLRRRR